MARRLSLPPLGFLRASAFASLTRSAVRSFLVDRIYRLVPSSDGGDDFVGIGDPLEARERVVG